MLGPLLSRQRLRPLKHLSSELVQISLGSLAGKIANGSQFGDHERREVHERDRRTECVMFQLALRLKFHSVQLTSRIQAGIFKTLLTLS